MTQKIYRPSPSGGELQLKVGSNWVPIYGLSGITVSGGDREVTTFETLDGGVESSVGAAGVKDINLTLNPSFFNAQYNKIIQSAYYGNDQISVRYRTLAQSADIAKGASSDTAALGTKIDAGYGKEQTVAFSAGTTEGKAGKTAVDAIKETAELGLILGTSAVTRDEEEPGAGEILIVRHDGTNVKASEPLGREAAMVSASVNWVLVRYGIAFEYECRVTTGGNPDFAPGSPIGDTLTLQQVASGFKKYPILKAAA